VANQSVGGLAVLFAELAVAVDDRGVLGAGHWEVTDGVIRADIGFVAENWRRHADSSDCSEEAT
jgi:hypothetical protein